MKTIQLAIPVLLAIAPCASAREFQVSPQGSDSNPGTAEKYFASLEKARDAVRGENGSTIQFAAGSYRLAKTFELGPQDSGTVIRPEIGADVRLSASVGNTLSAFPSTNLHEWKDQVAFTDKDCGICNTSVCKAGDRYVMSIEGNAQSKVNNGIFAARFLESKDLIHWTLTPPECRHGFDCGLCSPHLLRWPTRFH